MATNRISVRIKGDLLRRLEEEASVRGASESEIVRQAVEEYLAPRQRHETCYELARKTGLLGCVRNAPSDLSTNRKYFDGFGKR